MKLQLRRISRRATGKPQADPSGIPIQVVSCYFQETTRGRRDMFKKSFVIPLLAVSLSGCVYTVVQPPAPDIAGGEHEVPVTSYFGTTAQKPASYVEAKE